MNLKKPGEIGHAPFVEVLATFEQTNSLRMTVADQHTPINNNRITLRASAARRRAPTIPLTAAALIPLAVDNAALKLRSISEFQGGTLLPATFC